MTSVKELEKLIKEKEDEIEVERTRLKLISHVDELNNSEFVKWLNSVGIPVEFLYPDCRSKISTVLSGETIQVEGYTLSENPYSIFNEVCYYVFGDGDTLSSRLCEVLGLENVHIIPILENERQFLITGSMGIGDVRIDYKPGGKTTLELTNGVIVSGDVFGPKVECGEFYVSKTKITEFTGNNIFKKVQEKLKEEVRTDD